MKTIRNITNNIYYIGVSDRRLAQFENLFPLPNGVSYNSYFIDDEKTAVLDTVDRFVSSQYFDNIQAVLKGRNLDYLIVHHMEPDHAANIKYLLTIYPSVKIVCSQKAVGMLNQFFGQDFAENLMVVKEGDTLVLGQHVLNFAMTPMVHWPEVMVSFESKTGTLFSADAFGSFGANDGFLFNDEIPMDESWFSEARRYYSNIVGKYGPQVQAALKKIASLDVKIIAPLHGIIWTSNIDKFIEKYNLWSQYLPEEKGVLIAYGSMYGNTENAANALADTLFNKGVKNVAVKDVSCTDVSYLISLAFKYSHIVIASPTYNLGMYPKIEHFVLDMKALNLQNRTVAVIENSTWAPGVIKAITPILESMKNITIMPQQVLIKSALQDYTQIEDLAKALEQEII